MNKKVFYFFIFVLFFLIFKMNSNVYAQSWITVSPVTLETELRSGENKSFSLNLFNESNRELKFKIAIKYLYQSTSGEFLSLDTIETEPSTSIDADEELSKISEDVNNINIELLKKYTCVEWITLDSKDDILVSQPKKGTPINLRIKVPRNTRNGFYYAIIELVSIDSSIEESPELESYSSLGSIKLRMILFIPIFINVNNRAVVKSSISGKYARIEKFEIQEIPEGVLFSALLANYSNNLIEGKGKLQINKDGQKFKEFELGSGRGMVLPGQKLNKEFILQPPYIPGKYQAIAIIDYGGRKIERSSEINFELTRDKLVTSEAFINEAEILIKEPIILETDKDYLSGKIIPGSARNLLARIYNYSEDQINVYGRINDISFANKTQLDIKLAPESFEIEPNKFKNVRITLKCPEVIDDGNKYYQIDFIPENIGIQKLDDDLKEISSCPVYLMLENVKGNKTEKILIEDFQVTVEEKAQSGLFPHFYIKFRNTGDVHLQPEYVITFYGIKNEDESGLPIIGEEMIETVSSRVEDKKIILPGMDDTVEISLNNPIKMDEKQYKVQIKVINESKEIFSEFINISF